MTVAKIAEYQFIIRGNLKYSTKIFPSGEFGPKILIRKNPTTVGGNTKGRVNTTSIAPFTFAGNFLI